MYGVETILDKKIDPKTNDLKYLVKWEGFGLEQSSWEPYKHLKDDCDDIVQQFEQQNGMFITTELGKVFIANIDVETVRKVKESMGRRNVNKWKQEKQTENENEQQMMIKTPKKGYQSVNHNKRIKKNTPSLKVTPKQNSQQSQQQQQQQQKSLKKVNENRRLNMKRVNKERLMRNYRKKRNCLDQMTRQSYFEQEQKKSSQKASEQSKEHQNQKIESDDENIQKQTQQLKSSFRPIIIHNVESQKYLKSVNNNHRFSKQQTLEIIGMRRIKSGFEFYVGYLDGKKNWLSHNQVFNNHSKELCRFYQKNMTLD